MFDFTHAFVRGLPSSFLDSLKMHPPPEPIDLPRAEEEHATYERILASLLEESAGTSGGGGGGARDAEGGVAGTSTAATPSPRLLRLDPDPRYPDCVFIEDTCFFVHDAEGNPAAIIAR
jgi:hypothetical protein